MYVGLVFLLNCVCVCVLSYVCVSVLWWVVWLHLNTYDRSTNACCSCSLNLKLLTRTYLLGYVCVFDTYLSWLLNKRKSFACFFFFWLMLVKFIPEHFKRSKSDLFNAILANGNCYWSNICLYGGNTLISWLHIQVSHLKQNYVSNIANGTILNEIRLRKQQKIGAS